MKIGILSRRPELYSTQRLRKAAAKRGHDVRIVNFARCAMGLVDDRPVVSYGGQMLAFDAIVPRIGVSNTFYGTAVVRQFEVMGAVSAVSSQAITRARDKLRALQLLSREEIGIPRTGIAHSTKDTDGLLEFVGGPPVIVKNVEGTQGFGVVLAETRKAAESVIGAFRQLNADILVQEFIEESNGEDLRCFVVDGAVVAAMKRIAAPGEFRSNLHRGGSAEPVELTAREAESAVRAARSLQLGIAGVDLLRSKRGPLVMEVNPSPGLEGIEKTTGVDVGTRVIEFVERRVERAAHSGEVDG